jgi:hypothetical protein
MSTYLVLAHQTAGSAELLEALTEQSGTDPGAEFVLLVPETPAEFHQTEKEGSPREIARRAAQQAADSYRSAGIKLRWTIVSDQRPVVALESEIADHPDTYAGIFISTFPAGISRWLEDYVLQRAHGVGLPVKHIVATSVLGTTPETVME